MALCINIGKHLSKIRGKQLEIRNEYAMIKKMKCSLKWGKVYDM